MSFDIQAAIDGAFASHDTTIAAQTAEIAKLKARIAELEAGGPVDPPVDPPDDTGGGDDTTGPFPSAADTGVPAGWTAKRTLDNPTFSKDGELIEDALITGSVMVRASGVEFHHCKLVLAGYHGIRSDQAPGPVWMTDCEIDGQGQTQNGILGPADLLRCKIHGVENAISLWDTTTIKDSYIYGLSFASSDPHYDGIECNGNAKNIEIVHNTVINDHGQTSALMLNNEFGPLEGVLVEGNRLIGGGFSMYIDWTKKRTTPKNVRIINNRFGRGQYGYFAFYGYRPDVFDGNVDDVTGDILTA